MKFQSLLFTMLVAVLSFGQTTPVLTYYDHPSGGRVSLNTIQVLDCQGSQDGDEFWLNYWDKMYFNNLMLYTNGGSIGSGTALVLTASLADPSYTQCKIALESNGWTVTGSTTPSSNTLTNYDIVIIGCEGGAGCGSTYRTNLQGSTFNTALQNYVLNSNGDVIITGWALSSSYNAGSFATSLTTLTAFSAFTYSYSSANSLPTWSYTTPLASNSVFTTPTNITWVGAPSGFGNCWVISPSTYTLRSGALALATASASTTPPSSPPAAPVFTTQPAISPSAICAGTSFTTNTVAANGSPTSYQWEVSTDNGVNWTNSLEASANTTQLTSTPSTGGTYQYRCKATNAGGTGTSNVVTLTVNLNTAGAASSSPTVCQNTNMTAVTHSTTGATSIGTATGLPAGVTATFASNTITISGQVSSSATAQAYNYTIPLQGGCGTVNATGTITVAGINLTQSAQPSTASQVFCLNQTATALNVTASSVGSNVVYTWQVATTPTGSYSSASGVNNTNSYTPPATPGTFYYRCYYNFCNGYAQASTPSGPITFTDGAVWTGTVSTDATNSSNWNSTCGSGNKIILAGTTYSPEFTSLTIASGENFTINEGAKVTVNGVLTNSGTLVIRHNSTLVQGANSTYVGSGSEVVNVTQRITGGASATIVPTGRFWYLGSPVTNANATAFYSTSATNIVRERDEPNIEWDVVPNNSTTILTPAKGYYLRASNGTANSGNATSLSITFTGGGLNNGDVITPNLTSTGTSFTGYNLVSNPYPSYTDWTTITKTNVGGTMWYRTYDGTNMAFGTVNAGGVGTTVGTGGNSVVLTKYIPPMQSFWVRVSNYGQNASLTFKNSDRSHFTAVGSSVAGLKSTGSEQNLMLRMNLLQGEKSDQIILYTDNQASNTLDFFDAEKMMQADYPQFYTKVGEQKTVINALNASKKQQSWPITMELPTTGVHSFVIEDLEIDNGLVWLEDKQEEIMQALELGMVYEFYANSGINAERFVLHFNLLDITTPSAPNYGEVNSSANFSGKGASVHAEAAGVVVIKLPATTEGVTDIQIRDAAGRLVYTGSTNTLETSVQLAQANGIYYVTLNSASGVEVRKVFIQQ